MIQIQLPETFGTGTLHGLFYDRVCGGLNNPRKPKSVYTVSQGSFDFTQMNAALDLPISFYLPTNVDVKKLGLIAREAEDFSSWAESNFHKTPKMLFV